MALNPKEKLELKQQALNLFSPRTPISSADLFSGRAEQILTMVHAINQPGAHAIIYGERGVGKTSLANVAPLSFALQVEKKPIVAPRINCDGTDDYAKLWRKVLCQLSYATTKAVGIEARKQDQAVSLLDLIGQEEITPGVVQRMLSDFGSQCHLVVILDEFDRLPDGDVTRLIADTIKSLSDSTAPATLVVVGVGDTVAALVRGHESVRRHLVEVPLPRMQRGELEKIVTDRMPKLGLSIEDSTAKLISLLSRGLPYYTHLLGQHAACEAIDSDNSVVLKSHVHLAMHKAIADSEREMRRVYYEATKSRQPQNMYAKSLAACALAEKDEFGYFPAGNVREPMSAIMQRQYDIGDFAKHLERFSDKLKGGILQVTGSKHQKRYRFSDPLMEPFVVIKSLASEVISIDDLKGASQSDPEIELE